MFPEHSRLKAARELSKHGLVEFKEDLATLS